MRFLPNLLCLGPVILQSAQKVLETQGLIVPYISPHDPSLSHKYDNSSHYVPLIGRISTILSLVMGHMHLAKGNGSYHVVLLPDNHHTITQVRLNLVVTGQAPYLPLGILD